MTTTTDLAVRNGGAPAYSQAALAIKPGQPTWDEVQEAALVQIGLKDAPPADRAVLLHMSQRTGLDPFARQIMMIPRSEKKSERVNGQWVDRYYVKWTIQTGIDGWRVIRDRAERREGVRGILSRFTYYDDEDSEKKIWTRPEPPAAIEVTYTVRDRKGVETPYTSILRFTEYVQMKNGKAIAQWAPDAKPVHMLEKCCEADVYRKAFPQDFSGIYLDDAMPPAEDVTPPPPKVTGEEIRNRRPPQQVKSTVVDVAPEDAPWPGDAAPAAPGDAPADPRDAVIWHLDRLKITAYAAQGDVMTQLAGRAVSSAEELSGEEAARYAALLARCQARADVDALARDGEVTGE